MEQEIHIILRFNLAIGKVNLNEIVYKLKSLSERSGKRVINMELPLLKTFLIDYLPTLSYGLKQG